MTTSSTYLEDDMLRWGLFSGFNGHEGSCMLCFRLALARKNKVRAAVQSRLTWGRVQVNMMAMGRQGGVLLPIVGGAGGGGGGITGNRLNPVPYAPPLYRRCSRHDCESVHATMGHGVPTPAVSLFSGCFIATNEACFSSTIN